MNRHAHAGFVLSMLVLACVTTRASAQSLLERPANVHGDWVGTSGRLYFHFLHRFSASEPPARKVSNVPTFTLAAGLPARLLIGAHYATNSQLAPGYPNEWEFFIRHRPLAQSSGAPVDLGAQLGYNVASDGVDAEVSVARTFGPLRTILAGRVLADPFAAGETRFAGAAGATLRLNRYLALAADIAALLNATADEHHAWSAGVHVALPLTPHTLSLHAANTNAATLQGLSRGEETLRYGFEFTVPVTLQRWFGSSGGDAQRVATATPPTEAAHATTADPAARVKQVRIRDFAFGTSPLEISAGTVVEWVNDDPVAHTVSATEKQFESGAIQPGGKWRHTFAQPGTYSYYCTPHPFMKGEVVVK